MECNLLFYCDRTAVTAIGKKVVPNYLELPKPPDVPFHIGLYFW